MAISAKFRSNLVYEERLPLTSLHEDLNAIDRLAEQAAATRRKLRLVAGGIFVAGIVLATTVATWTVFAIAVGIALFIYSFIYGRGLLSGKSRVQFLRDLAGIVQQDSSDKAVFPVAMSLKARDRLLKEEPWTARKKGKQQFLRDEWFSFKGRLLDGTEFSETVVDLIRKRTYTNPRGKSKTKVKRRFLLTLRFSYPREVYGDARPIFTRLKGGLRAPPSTAIKNVDVGEKAITIKAVVNSETGLKESNAMLFLGAYRILNLSRRIALKGGAR